MKKIILALGLAAIVVAILVANGAAETKGQKPVCYGVIRDVDLVNHPGCSDVLCTIVENGWNATSDAHGYFAIMPVNGQYPPLGTYHVKFTKYAKAPVTIDLWPYPGTVVPVNINMSEILF